MTPENLVRAYSFLALVFEGQQRDPFCRICKARVNSAAAVREHIAKFESERGAEAGGLPDELRLLAAEAKSRLAGLALPENAAGQKKAGNCKLPQGVCFVKSSLAILQKI